MSSPYFQLKVLARTPLSVLFHVIICEDNGGGFDNLPRRILKVLFFGSDRYEPGGSLFYDSGSTIEDNEITFEQLWDDNWVEDNAHRFYSSATISEEHNHPYSKPWPREWLQFVQKHSPVEMFNAPTLDLPHCKLTITVPEPRLIEHLTVGRVHAYY